MIVQPLTTRLATAQQVLPAVGAQRATTATQTSGRVRLNLQVKRLSVEGLPASEQGIFLAAFRARINNEAQAAAQDNAWSKFIHAPHTAAIRHIDGGLLFPHMDARRMGEQAATTILRELLR